MQKCQSTRGCLAGARVFALCDDGLHLGSIWATVCRAIVRRRKGNSIRIVTLSFYGSLNESKPFSQHRPVISIDTKKKENIGQFKNGGQEWHPTGEPKPVKTEAVDGRGNSAAVESSLVCFARSADGCGGSNGYRNRLWKLKLQEFADESGLTLHVCHFPPGISMQ